MAAFPPLDRGAFYHRPGRYDKHGGDWRRFLYTPEVTFSRKVLTREAVVVGAGVSGLTSALRLAEAGFKVRIVARERTPGTTSDIAAAVWYPFRCGPADRGFG